MAARFPGLRYYAQHVVTNKDQFGITTHKRGAWDLDGFSELHFDDLDSMRSAVSSDIFAPSLVDETMFLDDVHIVACEKHQVVPFRAIEGPFIKRMTLLKRDPDQSPDRFRHEWLKVHADLVSQWPDVLGYHQNIVVERNHGSRIETANYSEVPVDGIVEFWFRNTEEAAKLYASDIVARTQEHAGTFIEEITPFFVETRRIV